MESGLNSMISQPTTFLESMGPTGMLASEGAEIVFPVLREPDVGFSMLALRDLREIAVRVIVEGGKHFFAEYALTSTWPVSVSEVVQEVGRRTGKVVRVERVEVQKAAAMLCNRVFKGEEPSSRSRYAAERLLLYYNRHGLKANARVRNAPEEGANDLASVGGVPTRRKHKCIEELYSCSPEA